jgi:hypothetical protein
MEKSEPAAVLRSDAEKVQQVFDGTIVGGTMPAGRGV